MALSKKVSWTDLKAIVSAKPSASIQAFLQEDHWFLSYTDGAYTLRTVLSTKDGTQAADVTDFVTNFLPSANLQIDTQYIRGNTDDTFIGNIGDRLKVTHSAAPGSGTSVIPAEMIMHLPEYLEDVGNNREMDVDGTIAKVFDFTPGASELWYLDFLKMLIVDPGSMDLDDFGSIPGPLTNGVLIEIKANGILHAPFNLTDNIDLDNFFGSNARGGMDSSDDDETFLDEGDQYKGIKLFHPVITLDGDQGDFVKATVRDDLRDLKAFNMILHKWKQI